MRVEYRNLAKHFARRVDGQQLHAVIGRSANQLDAAPAPVIHALIGIAFGEDIVAFIERRMLQMRQQLLGFGWRYLLEQCRMQQDVFLVSKSVWRFQAHRTILIVL